MHWLQAQLECGPGKGGSSRTRQRGAKEAALNCAARGLNARADAHFCDSSSQGVVGDQRGMPGRQGSAGWGDGNYAYRACDLA